MQLQAVLRDSLWIFITEPLRLQSNASTPPEVARCERNHKHQIGEEEGEEEVKDFTGSGSRKERKGWNRTTSGNSEPRIQRNGPNLQTKTQVTLKLHHTSLNITIEFKATWIRRDPYRSIQTLNLTKFFSKIRETFQNPQRMWIESKSHSFTTISAKKNKEYERFEPTEAKTQGFTLFNG